MKRLADRCGAILFGGLLLLTWLVTRKGPLRVDEGHHYHQIETLAGGEYVQNPDLTTFPGYHWLMAQFVRVTHANPILLVRGINVLLGAAGVLVFARCRRLLGNGNRDERVLQFALCPIIFPYFFLIYTDVPSLLLILVGVWLALERRYALCALALTASLAVRQTNVIWLVAVPAITWLQQTGLDYSWRNLRAFARANWYLGIGVAAFVAFVVVNQGVAIGDKSMHPLVFRTGNLFFLLFVYSVVLLPLVLARAPANAAAAFARPHGVLLFALFFALYLFTFDGAHPYNNIAPDIRPRNAVLMAVAASMWLKLLFFVPIMLAALDLAADIRERPILIPVVLASVAFLLPVWLIEQRYYIVSFALLLLFRAEASRIVERLTTFWFALLAVVFVYGYRQALFMI